MTYAERTEVTSERSRAEIERTLRRYQATGFAYGWNHDTATVMFEMEGRRIRFLLPLPDRKAREFTRTPTGRDRSGPAVEKAYEQAVRQRWRALSLVILAKLEAVEAGITTIHDEFLAHIVLPDGSTVGERTLPQLDAAYAGHQLPALLPGGPDA